MSERKNYADYKKDLYIWLCITCVPEKNKGEVVVYNLEGHPSRIKEKIIINISEGFGMQKMESTDSNFLDTIYKDDMANTWTK